MKAYLSLAAFLPFLLLSAQLATAQDKADEIMYKAYISDGDQTKAWKEAIAERSAAYEKVKTNKSRYDLALARFGLLSSTMRTQNEDLFDEYYKGTERILEEVIEADRKWAEPLALLSGVYGLKMGYSPMQGMFIGAKSNGLVGKAKKLDPGSPLTWKVYANSKYFTPEAFGGDLKQALAGYEECVKRFEAKPEQLKSNWMYLDALAFMGQACAKDGNIAKAIATYEKALAVEPGFGWVRYVLLPKAKLKTVK